MPVLEIKDFARLKSASRPILAVDHGEKVIGLAITDSRWAISSPLKNIDNKKFTYVATQIFEIIAETYAAGIIIGLPLNMDGSENQKCQSIRQFGRNLLKLKDIDILFFDERFSTVSAEETLSHSDLSYDRRMEIVDKIAASYILQGFLDRIEKMI